MAMAWSRDEVLKLIENWGDSAIQAQLEGCKRNQDVYDRIAADLRDAGFERTGKQCREKIKKLKGDYRKIKDKRNKTGEGRFPAHTKIFYLILRCKRSQDNKIPLMIRPTPSTCR